MSGCLACRKGTAILIGFLLLIALTSIKRSEAELRGNHHRKLGGHAMAYIDPENPEVCSKLPCVEQSPRYPCSSYVLLQTGRAIETKSVVCRWPS